MNLTLALSYGGKQEIFNAIKMISDKVKNNLIELNNFDDSIINSHLYTKNLPDVDLLIRTSGEQRISNFLLWQIAYAELYFTDVYWPDFSKDDFNLALENYKKVGKEDLEKQVNKYNLLKYFKIYIGFIFILTSTISFSQNNYNKGDYYVLDTIVVSGLKNFSDKTVVAYSGLRKGQNIQVPGEEIVMF